jgi:hypothetical protein
LLNFKVTGPSGTTGYTKVIIAKSIVPSFTGTTVSLDGKNLTFTVSSTSDYWIMEFTYSHSTHQVIIDLAKDSNQNTDTTPSQNPSNISTIPEFTTLALIAGIILTTAALVLTRKKSNLLQTAK